MKTKFVKDYLSVLSLPVASVLPQTKIEIDKANELLNQYYNSSATNRRKAIILIQKFKDKKTIKEISQSLGLSVNWTNKLFAEACNDLARHLPSL